MLDRSSIYIKNSTGSKNEPSGTPALINSKLEFALYVEFFRIHFPGNLASYHKFLKSSTRILNPHGKPNPKFVTNAKIWEEFLKRDSYRNICRFYALEIKL